VPIKFIKTTSATPAADHLARQINRQLKTGGVLWLVSGGSAIKVAVETNRRLLSNNLENLTVTLVDERYGSVDHPDSNWVQLKESGLALPKASLKPILRGESLARTTQQFAVTIKEEFDRADYKIGLFGIGADGHIAGIKPMSPGLDESQLAVGYEGDDYTRLTITPKVIATLDEAVVYMMTGKEKWPIVKQLAESDLPLQEQPAQILKRLKKVTIYNDYLGEEI
jgi:6-phosphogluconolactonase/glucosamine-6-phosphate isomerase/deaminase